MLAFTHQQKRHPRLKIAILAACLLAALACAAWVYTPDEPRKALEAKYAAAPSRFVGVLGVRLHVRDTGPQAAPAVILLHGFGSSLHTWEDWAHGLEADHRVVRFDLPGFGLTGADPSGDYSDARSLAVLLGLMDRLGIARAALVGSSMGGRIAWEFAAGHPDRVTRLVLVSPDGFASPGLAYGVAPKAGLTMRLLPYVLPDFLLRASLAPAYADRATMTGALVTRYRDMMLAPGVRRAILARMGQTVLQPPEPMLRRIACPTLLVWGDRDAMIPIGNARDYLAALPHARLVTLPGVGHLPQEEQPAGSLAVVREFLAE